MRKIKDQISCIAFVVVFPITIIIIILFNTGGLSFLSNISPDVALSNTYLCKNVEEECILLENNKFFSNEFANIEVCTTYSSSKPASLSILLLYKEQGPLIGVGSDRKVGMGEFKICYVLNDLVENMQYTNMEEDISASPVSNGKIQPGNYRIVFEQGRKNLEEIHFTVVEGE